MENSIRDEVLVLLALKLVQPGMLRDVADGLERLAPIDMPIAKLKRQVKEQLEEFREQNVVCLYSGRRYMLTARGEEAVAETGIRSQIESRRMFLLKETRRAKHQERSDTRNRPLEQQS